MRLRFFTCFFLFGAFGGLLPAVNLAAGQDIVRLKLQSAGWSERIGYYTPQRIELAAPRPASIQRIPDGIANARYGVLPFQGAANAPPITILLDESPGRAPRLLVDSNGNHDLTDDPPAEWSEKKAEGTDRRALVHFTGHVELPLHAAPGEPKVRLGLYRFDPSDPAHLQHADALFCYADYGFDGVVTLGGATYRAALSDDSATGVLRAAADTPAPTCSLLLDLNSDGRFAPDTERFDLRKPLEFLGGLFEIAQLAPSGDQFTLVTRRAISKSTPVAPELGVASKFEARTLDGKAVRFPEDYKGKLVLLDFWATWCRPCVAEVPTVVSAHERFHEKGFTVLGISLDGQATIGKLAGFTSEHKMNWPHVCEGQGWNSRLAQLYGVRSIPRAFLVDGDTGAILAAGSDVRGPNLLRSIEAALSRRSPAGNAP
jgi:peroxiredoxin